MELELGVQITRAVGDLNFVSTETDAVFVLFAHLPGFMRDEIEVELNEVGTEISISSRGETGERSSIEAEIAGRIRICREESMEGFRKAFPIPNNVVQDRIEVGFEEEEGILIVLLPKSTGEEEPSRVEMEEINEGNIREEEEERTSMTVEMEETTPGYEEEKAQEQKNLAEVEPKKSTEELEGKPDGKPEAGHKEAITKIAIGDKEDRESELIIEDLDFPITPSISEEPIAFRSSGEEEVEEEEENNLEEKALEQKNLDELELSESCKALESEPEGETEPKSKKIAIRALTGDKEEEIGVIIEEPDFTITPPPLEEPIVSEASKIKEEEEKAVEEKEQKQKNLDELEPKRSSGESEGEPNEKTEPQHKEMASEAEINNDKEEESELTIDKPDFTISPPTQEEPVASKAYDSTEEEKKEEEKKKVEEKPVKEKVEDRENLDELRSKKSLEALEGEPNGKEDREMATEAQPSDKEEKKTGFIIEESDFTKTSTLSEKPVASKAFELKEEGDKTTDQKNLDELEPSKSPEALEGEPDGETKSEHREMAIEAQTGDKEEKKIGLITEEPYFTRITPPSEEPVEPKASELKEEEGKKAKEEKVLTQKDLDELEPKKGSEALEGEPDGEIKPEHTKMPTETQNGDKEEEKTGHIIEEPNFTRIPPPSEEPVEPKASELNEEEGKKAIEKKVLTQKDLDELEPKEGSEALEGEPDGEIKLEHTKMPTETQNGDKEKEKTGHIIEEPEFTRIPPPSEEPVEPKASELKEEEGKKAKEEKVLTQKDLDELEPKKVSEALEGELDGDIKSEHTEMPTETQNGGKEEEKTGHIIEEPNFTRIPPPSEELVEPKASELKKEEGKKAKEEEVLAQKDLDELKPKKDLEALEGEPDGEIKPEHTEMPPEAQNGNKEEEKTGHIIEEPDFTRIPPSSKEPNEPKAIELKEEEGKKAKEEKVLKQKDLDELEPKKGSEALEGEPDGDIKPEHTEMPTEAQNGDKEEEKTGLIIEEPYFTRKPPPSEPKASELKKEEGKKAKEEKVLKQKDSDKLEPKKGSEALEGEPDGDIKSEHTEMPTKAQNDDKEEEKTGLIIEEPDFTRIPSPSEEPVEPKASELKEEEEKKAKEEKDLKQNDFDELEPKKGSEILKALEGEPDGKTKPEHREMTIEAQIGDKEEEKLGLIREEADFTTTRPPSEELIASKALELKEEEEKAAEEEVPEQKDLNELEPNKSLEALEGEPDGVTGPEHKEMATETRTHDKKEEQTGFIIEEPDFSRTLPSADEPIVSKDSELEKKDEKATEEKVPKQKDPDKLEPKKISEAQESEFDGETRAEHEEMAIEAQTDYKEVEQTGLIKDEPPDFTKNRPLLTEPITSKASELKEQEEGEKTTKEKAQEQKNLDEVEVNKGPETLEGELDGDIESELIEMATEALSEHKEEEQIGIDTNEPEFTVAPPALEGPILFSPTKLKEEEENEAHGKDTDEPKNFEEKIQSKARKELEKEENEKALEEKPHEQKSPDELETKKSSEELEGEPYRETESDPKKPAIEMQTEYKEEEKTRRITEEPDFTVPPTVLEDLIASKVSESKEEEEEQQEAPTKETPYLPPISPILMAKPELNEEQLDTTDSHEEQGRVVEVPGRALETSESTESPQQEEGRQGFGEEDAKGPNDVEEIAHDPAPKTVTEMATPEDADSDRRHRDGEHETRETETRALQGDDREIASDVDGEEENSREEEEEEEGEEGEFSDRDREESRGEMETMEEEKENNKDGMNGRGKKARKRRRRRASSFQIPLAGAVAGSAFMLSLVALVIRLMKKRRAHAVR